MPFSMPRMLADWLAFHATHAALRRLDPYLRADLGLTDADLRRISRRAVHHEGPISIYRLVGDDIGEERVPCGTLSACDQGISSTLWHEIGSASESSSSPTSMESVKKASLPRLHHSYWPET